MSMPTKQSKVKQNTFQTDSSLMDELFIELTAIYTARFSSSFKTPASISLWRTRWAEEFIREGIRPEQVRQGILACRSLYDWPPSLPEFIRACKPARPDPCSALVEAVAQMARRQFGIDTWSHPAIYWAALELGEFALRNSTWSFISERWTRLLDAEMAKGAWPAVPPYRKALPAPGQTSNRDTAVKHMAEIKAILKPQGPRG